MNQDSDEIRFLEITAAVMSDETPVVVAIDVRSAWVLVSAMQLATRHPELSDDIKTYIIKIASGFEDAILLMHPDAQELLERGWNQMFDVLVDDDDERLDVDDSDDDDLFGNIDWARGVTRK